MKACISKRRFISLIAFAVIAVPLWSGSARADERVLGNLDVVCSFRVHEDDYLAAVDSNFYQGAWSASYLLRVTDTGARRIFTIQEKARNAFSRIDASGYRFISYALTGEPVLKIEATAQEKEILSPQYRLIYRGQVSIATASLKVTNAPAECAIGSGQKMRVGEPAVESRLTRR